MFNDDRYAKIKPHAVKDPDKRFFLIACETAAIGSLRASKNDMQTICACLDLGEQLLTASLERYGRPALLGAMRYVCDADAVRMATALARIPDGQWKGEALVDDEPVQPELVGNVLETLCRWAERVRSAAPQVSKAVVSAGSPVKLSASKSTKVW